MLAISHTTRKLFRTMFFWATFFKREFSDANAYSKRPRPTHTQSLIYHRRFFFHYPVIYQFTFCNNLSCRRFRVITPLRRAFASEDDKGAQTCTFVAVLESDTKTQTRKIPRQSLQERENWKRSSGIRVILHISKKPQETRAFPVSFHRGNPPIDQFCANTVCAPKNYKTKEKAHSATFTRHRRRLDSPDQIVSINKYFFVDRTRIMREPIRKAPPDEPLTRKGRAKGAHPRERRFLVENSAFAF